MVANKMAIGPDGQWLLPFWREQGGEDCMESPDMHGKAGVLISEDKVRGQATSHQLNAMSAQLEVLHASGASIA